MSGGGRVVVSGRAAHRQVGDVGAGGLAFGHLAADLGDVLQPATTGVDVEAELNGCCRRWQQAELPGGFVCVHTLIMTMGCDVVSRGAKHQRVGGAGR